MTYFQGDIVLKGYLYHRLTSSLESLPPANEVCEGNVFTGVCAQGSLSKGESLSKGGGVSVQGGGLCPRGGSLSRGLCPSRGLYPGGPCQGDPPQYGNEQAVHDTSYWNAFLFYLTFITSSGTAN